MLMCMRLKQIHTYWPQVFACKRPLSISIMTPKQTCAMVTNLNCFVFKCRAFHALSRVSPASAPRQQTMLLMLADKHTRNAFSFSDPSNHVARGVPKQDTLMKTPLWSTMMKAFSSRNGCRDPKQADRNDSGQLPQSPQVSICPPPLLGHYLMVTSLLDWSEVIIWQMKDGNGKRTFDLGLIVTMSCHPWDSNAKLEQNQLNSLQQDSPIPSFPRKQTPRQPDPGLSGIQWLEGLFRCPSQPSEPHENASTREPEPEVALTQSMEEPFV
ncbi:hypothetical protein O181_063560 [Austropuccinia psidii MF-1]|uniref:Uncharacterized protein n=1 Tax=Austropuccinia psidii MF-1 TaxID=1389203 RepID=A0A9Q3EJ06_9BASI|nr:hypothetical protein [Austropuccinia psidii MF-1]